MNRNKNILLWIVAVILMLAAMFYQRTTGPTYPYKGELMIGGKYYKYALSRSQNTTSAAVISLPDAKDDTYTAVLHYKRYGTDDDWTETEMKLKDGKVSAALPLQPAAGKMEYYITGNSLKGDFKIPEKKDKTIILRYKDPVPLWILLPHILMMFLALLFGMRAGLGALFQPETMRKWAKAALIAMTLGGLMLGPLVQKFAFGEYWTGFPYGRDYTDNKMLIMWLAWAITLPLIGWKSNLHRIKHRIIVVIAALIMTVTYLIPHSMGGSTLDYSQVDKGVNPAKAIRTGGEH